MEVLKLCQVDFILVYLIRKNNPFSQSIDLTLFLVGCFSPHLFLISHPKFSASRGKRDIHTELGFDIHLRKLILMLNFIVMCDGFKEPIVLSFYLYIIFLIFLTI